MSDYLIDLLAGTKDQEDLIWRMVKVAKEHSDKTDLELSKFIRTNIQKMTIVKGENLADLKEKSPEERKAFVEECIVQLVPLLGIDDEEILVAKARKVYREWLAEQDG